MNICIKLEINDKFVLVDIIQFYNTPECKYINENLNSEKSTWPGSVISNLSTHTTEIRFLPLAWPTLATVFIVREIMFDRNLQGKLQLDYSRLLTRISFAVVGQNTQCLEKKIEITIFIKSINLSTEIVQTILII